MRPGDLRTNDYVLDVPYLRNFVEELAPPRLRMVAALNGFAPPPGDGFDYCELGSGRGDTLATLAAAHPDARFVGVDINAEHVAFASELAARGGLDNVRFLERDFEDMAADALPSFDYVGAHGVLAWVSPAKRAALLAFAAARLKPGGLLTVSYNALPGWAAVEPLRRLMLDSASGVQGTTLDRARHGVHVAKLMSDAGAGYFTQNPSARAMLDTIEKGGLPYVVHEYFHASFCPMYFTDVAREMAAKDLYFVGQLPLYQNYKDVAVPPSVAVLCDGITDRIVLERVKDFATNEFFRRDVYVKGRAACDPALAVAYLDTTPFALPFGRVAREVKLPHFVLQYGAAIFDALAPALAGAARTAPELASRPELAPFGQAKIRDALLRLLLGDQVIPTRRSTLPAAPVADPRAARYRVPLAYNRMVLDQRPSRDSLVVLASPVAGTGFTLSTLQTTCLRVLTEIEPEARSAWLRSFVREQPVKLSDGDRAITDLDEQARVIERQLGELVATRVPELVHLGVLERR
jgi:SAM-dependent methyltransferase